MKSYKVTAGIWVKDRYVYLEIHGRVSRIQSENTYFSIFTRRKIHSKKVGRSVARRRDEAWRIPDDKCRTPWQTDVQSRILSTICRLKGNEVDGNRRGEEHELAWKGEACDVDIERKDSYSWFVCSRCWIQTHTCTDISSPSPPTRCNNGVASPVLAFQRRDSRLYRLSGVCIWANKFPAACK